MIQAGIIGGSGYTGGELIRLLLAHPHAEVAYVYSTTRAGKPLHSAHPDLAGLTEQEFTGKVSTDIDVLFLCLGHGNSKQFLQEHPMPESVIVIDLSNDFRLGEAAEFGGREFVYGLPEVQARQIAQSLSIANPGCFATAIELALLPLAQAGLLDQEVHINAMTGSTGAGVSPTDSTHFSWRNNNISWYKPFTHQHLGEIGERLSAYGKPVGRLNFLPLRGNFTRGILATAYLRFAGSLEDAYKLYREFYAEAAFTQVVDEPIALKQVVNTNQCHLHLHRHEDLLLVTSALDNLLKGASGQAVQNMNLVFGLPETTGLQLKASVF